MAKHLKFDDEDLDNYLPSESEDEYTEKEKELLSKVQSRRKSYSDREDEVFGVGSDGSDNSDIALSDIEGQDDDDLPNEKAWGKDKRKYYSTDYVDADYGGFEGKDAQLAELEEQEARNLQKQLAEQLDDDDFALHLFSKNDKESKKDTEEVIKTDISKLTKRQKIELLQKDSPEFFALVEDFKSKQSIVKDFLSPVLQKFRKGQLPNDLTIEFVENLHELILNYLVNIYMYLLLKSSKVNVQNHPIAKRLYQYRQMLSQLDETFNEIIKPQIEIILQDKDEKEPKAEVKEKKSKVLKLLKTISKTKPVEKPNPEPPAKKIKFNDVIEHIPANAETDESDSSEDENQPEPGPESDQQLQETDENSKRAITYQMAKNKGLTPHRKKEQRNPRVKHRQKFRKALIRRKGAVRAPRKELSRYSGEISGIKASVKKGIKIKT